MSAGDGESREEGVLEEGTGWAGGWRWSPLTPGQGREGKKRKRGAAGCRAEQSTGECVGARENGRQMRPAEWVGYSSMGSDTDSAQVDDGSATVENEIPCDPAQVP